MNLSKHISVISLYLSEVDEICMLAPQHLQDSALIHSTYRAIYSSQTNYALPIKKGRKFFLYLKKILSLYLSEILASLLLTHSFITDFDKILYEC